MIKRLSVKNFKSVKELEIECGRVNLFIGDADTGKSNILEGLGLLNWAVDERDSRMLKDYARFSSYEQLFFNNDMSAPVHIEIDLCQSDEQPQNVVLSMIDSVAFDYDGIVVIMPEREELLDSVKFYRMAHLQREFGEKLENEHDCEFPGEPFVCMGDTCKAMAFYMAAIQSNVGASLIFEEPECHSFAHEVGWLGEKIALDDTNQYFLTTHSPYMLLSILEKTNKQDVRVFITYKPGDETLVKSLSLDEISKLLVYGPFMNLDRFIGEEVQSR